MRILVLSIMLLFGANAYVGDSIDAPGKVFYKLPDESIVKRDVVLTVPSRGEGKVYLRSGRISVEAARFFSRELNGRTIFYVIFDQYPGQSSENELAVYRGTYTRGSNLALYYGDVFKVGRSTAMADQDELHLDLTENSGISPKYIAGFYFKYEIE